MSVFHFFCSRDGLLLGKANCNFLTSCCRVQNPITGDGNFRLNKGGVQVNITSASQISFHRFSSDAMFYPPDITNDRLPKESNAKRKPVTCELMCVLKDKHATETGGLSTKKCGISGFVCINKDTFARAHSRLVKELIFENNICGISDQDKFESWQEKTEVKKNDESWNELQSQLKAKGYFCCVTTTPCVEEDTVDLLWDRTITSTDPVALQICLHPQPVPL